MGRGERGYHFGYLLGVSAPGSSGRTAKYRNVFDAMSLVQVPRTCQSRTASMLLPSTMVSHAVWLVTPTMMIRHHSATPLALVVTT